MIKDGLLIAAGVVAAALIPSIQVRPSENSKGWPHASAAKCECFREQAFSGLVIIGWS
jgi:hypothetical protein